MSLVDLSDDEEPVKDTTEVGTVRRGEERQDQEPHQEQRVARDGIAYTYEEFRAHYSTREKAEEEWETS